MYAKKETRRFFLFSLHPTHKARLSGQDSMIRGALSLTSRRSGVSAAASALLGGTARPTLITSTSVLRSLRPMASSITEPLYGIDRDEATSPPPSQEERWSPPLTKIVATIGPTSEQLPVLQEVVRAGMSVMRLNFSHATVEEVELRTNNLKLCEGRHSSAKDLPCYGENSPAEIDQNVRAILLDTRGPEIRTGKLANDHSGHETVVFEAGGLVTLRTAPEWVDKGSTASDLYIDYPNLHKSIKPGMKVLLDDGAIILTATAVESDKEFHGSVTCSVDNAGELRSRAGVNLPGAETDLPAMSDKDRVDIKYGMSKGVDFVAASFIQNAEGVQEIKRYMQECAKELGWPQAAPLPLIISKIESTSGLKNFDAILEESDGIMVARGDLGVEIPLHLVTNAQKEMVSACNAVGKPVIVATQMLESMAKNPRPTRAEVADVSNAVYDGADAVMLSGETAKGKYPVETITTMNEIIKAAEKFETRRTDLVHRNRGKEASGREVTEAKSHEATLAKSAVTAAAERHASAILVLTNHGTLPRMVSANRPSVPIVAFCPSSKVARMLMLNRGVHPIIGLEGVSTAKRPMRAIQHATNMGFIQPGDNVVVVTMESDEDIGNLATMKVATVPKGITN